MADLIDRQAAIDALEKWLDEWTHPNAQGAIMDCIQTLNGMPSAQPEQTTCEYCHEDFEGCVKPIEKNCHAFVRFGMNGWELSMKANGWHGSAKIQYCPMCGRRLTDG